VPGREYLIGVDLAKLNDYTVFTVMDMDTKAAVALDRFQQVDYTVQLRRLEALSQRFNPTSIIVERNVGEMFIEVAQRMNLPVRPFMTTNASKQTIIEELALAFEQGAIQIPNDDVLKNELKAFAMERLPGGLLRFNAPAGFHDDMVISLALAYYGCKVHSTGDPLVFDDFPVW
jgi:phage FluMu gp28-like protein